MYYNSYDEYCDSMEPDKITIPTAILPQVTEKIRDLLLNAGDDLFEDDDLRDSVIDYERNSEFPEWVFASVELRDDGRDDGQTGWYSREFAFDEVGTVVPIWNKSTEQSLQDYFDRDKGLMVGCLLGGKILTGVTIINAEICKVIAHHNGKPDSHATLLNRKQQTIRDLMLAGF